MPQPAQILVPRGAAFNPGPELAKHGRANPDPMAAPPFEVGALANAVDVVDELLSRAGIQEESLHGVSPNICVRTASMLKRRNSSANAPSCTKAIGSIVSSQ